MSFFDFMVSNPELVVVVGYSLSIFLNEEFGRKLPVIGDWTLAEYGALATSLFYQFNVVAAETGLESVFTSLTGAVFFGVIAKKIIFAFGFNN